MPVIGLLGYVVFALLAFGLRAAIHYRRTGTSGFVGIRGSFGSVEWIAGVLFVAAMLAAFAAPVLELAGVVAAYPSLDRPVAHAVGLAAFAAGVVSTLWAQLAMGDSWRVGVDTDERTALVRSGPFRWVRNPIFSSMTLATLGLALVVPNVVSLLALAMLVLALEIHVRRVEEPYLAATHGEQYRGYARATGRFVPGIGRLG